MKVIRVETVQEAMQLLIDQPYDEARKIYRYLYVYRGIPNSFLEETSNTVKYVISKEIRWHLRDALDQMNINERMIYPGLDGLARVEGRHYYVRE